jgi:hypothetical protein
MNTVVRVKWLIIRQDSILRYFVSDKNLLTGCAKSRIFVVTIRAVRCSVAQVLDGDADSVSRTSERFIGMASVS